MARIFISHNSQDAQEAIALKQWLTDSGWDDVFLDIDPKRGLSPGERWKDALRTAADRCEAVLCLVSPTWLASAECKLEFRYAEQLRKHIFLAIIKPCDSKDLPPDWQWCPLYGQGAQTFIKFEFREKATEISFLSDGLQRLKNGLEKAGISAESFPWPPENEPNRAPYRGLKPLEAVDAAVFFGRNADILRGMETLRDMRLTGIERLLVILGASGSGKSSFMRAGLLPRLTRDDSQFFPLPVIRPRNAVLYGEDGLAKSLADAFSKLDRNLTLGEVEKWLQAGPEAAESLLAKLEQRLLLKNEGAEDRLPPSLILPIDQAEELFNPDGEAEAAPFLEFLGKLLLDSEDSPLVSNTYRRLLVVLTIRSDRYERLQTIPGLTEIKPRLFDLRPFPPGQFERVINGPAECASKAGHKLIVDAKLSERLLADFAEGADTLPLLGFALEKLCHKFGGDGDMTLAEYESIRGGHETVQAAIFQEAITSALSEPYRTPVIPSEPKAQMDGLRRAFIPYLARINPETNDPMRQVAKLAELPADVHPLVERLVEARLLIRDKNTIEVAHESLLRQWPSLYGWLLEDRDKLRLLETIRQAAADWHRENCRDDLLFHRDGRLKDAEALLATPGFVVAENSKERLYLNACVAAQEARDNAVKEEQERRIRDAERIAEEQKKAARNRMIGLKVAAALSIVAFVVAGIAIRQYINAEKETRRAELEKNKALALKILSDARLAEKSSQFSYQLKILLMVESIKKYPSEFAKLELRMALNQMPRPLFSMQHKNSVRSLEITEDGKYLASGSEDDTVRIWDIDTGKELWRLPHRGVDSLSFSQDGKTLASGGTYGLHIWETDTGKPLAHYDQYYGGVDIKLSPDGKMLAYGDSDDITIRNLANETELWHFKRTDDTRDGRLNSLAFSPYCNLLAESRGEISDNGKCKGCGVRVWDLVTGKPFKSYTSESSVSKLFFNSYSKSLTGLTNYNSITDWDLVTDEATQNKISDFTISVIDFNSKKFKEQGIIFGNSNGVIKGIGIYEDISLQFPLDSAVNAIALLPERKRIVSAGEDGVVRVWALNPNFDSPPYHERAFISLNHLNGSMIAAVTPSLDEYQTRLMSVNKITELPIEGQSMVIISLVQENLHIRIFESSGERVVDLGESELVQVDPAKLSNFKKLIKFYFAHQSEFASQFKAQYKSSEPKNISQCVLEHISQVEEQLQIEHEYVLREILNSAIRIVGSSPTIKLFDLTQGKELRILWQKGNNHIITSSFSPDGSKMAISLESNDPAGQYSISVWDLTSRKELWNQRQNQSVEKIAFAPDGKSIATISANNVWLWDSDSGNRLWNSEPAETFNFNPHTHILAIASDKSVILKELVHGKELGRMNFDDTILNIAYSPDGKLLAISVWETLHIRDVASGKDIQVISVDEPAKSLSINRDGKTLASVHDGEIWLWDILNGSKLEQIPNQGKPSVNSVEFTSDGKYLITRTGDPETVSLLPWETSDLIHAICERSIRNLSLEEWNKYFKGLPYAKTCNNLPMHPSVIEEAQKLAKAGKHNDAQHLFEHIASIDPTLKIDPTFETNRWERNGKAEIILEKVKTLWKEGKYGEFMKTVDEALTLNPDATPLYQSWYKVCWDGTLAGQANLVLKACDLAVEKGIKEGNPWLSRDSRGLARALTGNTDGAIEDFEYFIENADDAVQKKQRQAWVSDLKAGKNPFNNPELIKALKNH